MKHISTVIIFGSIIVFTASVLFAGSAFAREIWVCTNPVTTAGVAPPQAHNDPAGCNSQCSGTCAQSTISDAAETVFACPIGGLASENQLSCDFDCGNTEDICLEVSVPDIDLSMPMDETSEDGEATDADGGATDTDESETESDDSGTGSDGGAAESENGFLPLVQCGNEGPKLCTLCDAFQLLYRIIQFLFYGIMLPLVAVAFIIGGILLLTAAGNETKVDQGKRIIWNTFIGFLVAFAAWLIISTIIVNITPGIEGVRYNVEGEGKINFKWYQFPGCEGGPPDAPLPGINLEGTGDGESEGNGEEEGDGEEGEEPTGPPSGKCVAPPAGNNCSPESLQANGSDSCSFGSNIDKASKICFGESGGVINIKSGSDFCDNNGSPLSFSHGLFQINIIAHEDKIGGACKGLFDKNGSGTQGTKLGCEGNKCFWDCFLAEGKDISDYQSCLNQVTVQKTNIDLACQISENGTVWHEWGFNKECKF